MHSYNHTEEDAERFFAKVNKTGECWTWSGNVTNYGYGRFRLNGPKVLAHRLSWAIEHGAQTVPPLIDHACRNKLCVNPSHLREATRKQNGENLSGPTARSTSGVRGVTWHKRAGKWTAYVRHAGKTVYLGLFLTIAEAEAAVTAKRNELFTHNDADRVQEMAA